ncbi:MAG: GDSL-type esterase/lipase family protein [Tomitella sp.]|nr:GDSL-type esterase/lipase family protein [Tomitella sp.]
MTASMPGSHTLPATVLVTELHHFMGHYWGIRPCRLPEWARALADPQLLSAQALPAGVRLVFRTSATIIELVAHRIHMVFRGVAPRPDCRFDLVIDGELVAYAESSAGTTVIVDAATGTSEVEQGPDQTVRFDAMPSGEKTVEIWLPHYETIDLVALRTDGRVEPVLEESRRWLHYGSSISQGSNATSPTGTWTARVARSGGLALTNLGFSGSAMLDPFVARVIRDRPADLISIKVGINLVNGDVMRMRAFTPCLHGFLDTIRDGHPTTPILVISPIYCGIHEQTPGPAATDFGDGTIRYRATGDPHEVEAGKLTLRTVREEIKRIVELRRRHDENLHYLNGLELFDEADAERHPLPDRLHPDSDSHALIADRFYALTPSKGGALAAWERERDRR